MQKALDERVRERAENACEYCWLPQLASRIRFPIEHILAQQHGGVTELDNLALCCARCNRYKGPNIAGVDPTTGQVVTLFHPRRDRWSDHFVWQGPELVGRTPQGRVTIAVLNINHPSYVKVRNSLIAEGEFPLVSG